MATETTMHLLHKALSVIPNASEWARQLSMSRSALLMSRARGRLSPTAAGNLARLLGEDVDKWVVIAALEGEPKTYALNKVRQAVKALNAYLWALRLRGTKGTSSRRVSA